MGKVISASNMALDGVYDHTTGIADEGLHQHYSEPVDNSGVVLYGRTTYQLMQFWQTLLQNPSGKKSMDELTISIDKILKLIFSNILKDAGKVRNLQKNLLAEIPHYRKLQNVISYGDNPPDTELSQKTCYRNPLLIYGCF